MSMRTSGLLCHHAFLTSAAMTATLVFLGLPAAFLVGMGVLFFTKRRRGIAAALGLFAASFAAGAWAILQSRASTAGIGFLFLPAAAALAGAFGWAFGNLRKAQTLPLHAAGWVCLLAALTLPVWQIVGGMKSIELNQRRDAEQAAHAREIVKNRELIAVALAQNPGREIETLERMIAEHALERAFLIPALESRWVTSATLDRMADSTDLGIVLQAVRHANCPPATLARVYRTSAYPFYFEQALLANPNTPADIRRELEEKSK
jgi:hypothetical protein